MKNATNRHSKNLTRILAALLAFLVIMSVIFSLRGFFSSAYTQQDLATATEKEANLKQALDAAKAEALRLESFKQIFNDEELGKLISDKSNEMSGKIKRDFIPVADKSIKEITPIYANKTYDELDRYNYTGVVIDQWTGDVNKRIDEMIGLANEVFDQYIAAFSGTGIDYSLAKGALIWEINNQRNIINNAILDFYKSLDFDTPYEEPPVKEPPAEKPPVEEPSAEEPPAGEPSGEDPSGDESSVEEQPAGEPSDDEPSVNEPPAEESPVEEYRKSAAELSSIVYDTLNDVKVYLIYAIEDLPDWVNYCIDDLIAKQNVNRLEGEWVEAWTDLARVKRAVMGYDYSLYTLGYYHEIGSGEDCEVLINGDPYAVENVIYFDIYTPFWSDEAGGYMLAGIPVTRGNDYKIEQSTDGTIILTVSSNYLDTLAVGAQLLSLYYCDGENIEWVDFYVEIEPEPVIDPEEDELVEIAVLGSDSQKEDAGNVVSGSYSISESDASEEIPVDNNGFVLRPLPSLLSDHHSFLIWILMGILVALAVLILIFAVKKNCKKEGTVVK